MALYLVERDLSDIAPERIRLDQRDIASACIQLKSLGKRIRYISSAVVPADARSMDLFGAASPDLITEAYTSAGVRPSRVVEILDLTPSFVHGTTSRSRRSAMRAVGTPTRPGREIKQSMTEQSAPLALTRWLADGQRFFAVCLEVVERSERLQARNETLEGENAMLREELARLRHKADMLQTERSEMVAAFNDLAGHVTQVVDHILQKSEDGDPK